MGVVGARDTTVIRSVEGVAGAEQRQIVTWRSLSSWDNKTFAKVNGEHFQTAG